MIDLIYLKSCLIEIIRKVHKNLWQQCIIPKCSELAPDNSLDAENKAKAGSQYFISVAHI